jgi:hypothetical protein
VVDHIEAVGVAFGQGVELGSEDDRVALAVGVEEAHPPVGRGQRALDQGEHGCDAAARAEGDGVAVAGPEAEDARGHAGLDDVAGGEGVDHPVRHDPAGHPLHGHLQLVVDGG